jgi:hypothetical protein
VILACIKKSMNWLITFEPIGSLQAVGGLLLIRDASASAATKKTHLAGSVRSMKTRQTLRLFGKVVHTMQTRKRQQHDKP